MVYDQFWEIFNEGWLVGNKRIYFYDAGYTHTDNIQNTRLYVIYEIKLV